MRLAIGVDKGGGIVGGNKRGVFRYTGVFVQVMRRYCHRAARIWRSAVLQSSSSVALVMVPGSVALDGTNVKMWRSRRER